jgi:hypothetical protein
MKDSKAKAPFDYTPGGSANRETGPPSAGALTPTEENPPACV